MRYEFSLTEADGSVLSYEYYAKDFPKAHSVMLATIEALLPGSAFTGEALEHDGKEYALDGPYTIRGT